MPERRHLGRLPTRVRTAGAAGLAALLLLGGGAWWLRQHVHDSRLGAQRTEAEYQARTIVGENAQDKGARDVLRAATANLPFLVLDPDGRMVMLGGPLTRQTLLREQLTPAPAGAPPSWTTTRTVTVGRGGPDSRYAGHTFDAVGAAGYVDPTGLPAGATDFAAGPGVYTVYVLVTPFEAEQAVAALDPALWAGVPLSALLVAAFAWAATSRALRPVEAIRRELAEIGERNLDRRVPVPGADDEIAQLAATTNTTLDRLQRSAEQQSRFVADAAHELRSPIAALRTNLEVSLAHPDRTDWPAATGDALAAVRRLQGLAEDLLLLARPADPALPAAPVDLSGIAQDLVAEYRHSRPGGPRYLLTEPQPPVPARVLGRAVDLTRVLRNLLDNASRHADSTVTVTVASGADAVRLTVHNDGSEIPPADRDRIFERFTRLDDSRSRDVGGSGLGLAIARELALRHGGTLDLGTPAPGTPAGPTFVLTLPPAPFR